MAKGYIVVNNTRSGRKLISLYLYPDGCSRYDPYLVVIDNILGNVK